MSALLLTGTRSRVPRKVPLLLSGGGLLALLLFRLTGLLRCLLLSPALFKLSHVLAQAERPHVGPHLVNVGTAFGARPFLDHLPAVGHRNALRHERILLL